MDQESATRCLVTERAKLLAYLISIVRNQDAAEDLYQDVLVLALQKHDEIKDADHLLAWARQAARYRAIDYLRRQGRQPLLLSEKLLELLDDHWAQADQQSSARRITALRSCIAKLTDYSRQLLRLRYGDGMSGTEVAATVQREPHTVYTALSRTYRKLRLCMERSLAEEEQT